MGVMVDPNTDRRDRYKTVKKIQRREVGGRKEQKSAGKKRKGKERRWLLENNLT